MNRKHQSVLCPGCKSPKVGVIDSRPVENRTSVRRRRECEDCGGRWTTWETTKHPSQPVSQTPDWQALTEEQRRILTRIIHDFARDNQKVVSLKRPA